MQTAYWTQAARGRSGAARRFATIYPRFRPAAGMEGIARSLWAGELDDTAEP